MRLSDSSLVLATLLGGLGGAINAWMFYATQPTGTADWLRACWSIVPAGALHGAVLAQVGVAMAKLAMGRRWAVRLALLPVTGWLAGWLSFAPISRYSIGFSRPCAGVGWDAPGAILRELAGHLEEQSFPSVLLWPFVTFGLVSLIYSALLVSVPRVAARSFALHVSLAVASGVVGSLSWWLASSWWTSVAHGSVWGVLVGAGVWAGQRRSAPVAGQGPGGADAAPADADYAKEGVSSRSARGSSDGPPRRSSITLTQPISAKSSRTASSRLFCPRATTRIARSSRGSVPAI